MKIFSFRLKFFHAENLFMQINFFFREMKNKTQKTKHDIMATKNRGRDWGQNNKKKVRCGNSNYKFCWKTESTDQIKFIRINLKFYIVNAVVDPKKIRNNNKYIGIFWLGTKLVRPVFFLWKLQFLHHFMFICSVIHRWPWFGPVSLIANIRRDITNC